MDTMTMTDRKNAAISRGVGMTTQIYAERAENSEIWDKSGRRYIDFAAGIAVLNTGHRHPRVIAAVKAQLDRFTHTCHQVVPYESYVHLAERLNRITPGNFEKKTIFVTTGAEAVENAVKIARAATGRSAVIAFGGGFHGRTFMGMALTGKVVPYKVGFGAMPGDVFHVPFPVELHGITSDQSLAALKKLFAADVDPQRVAAIIIEPVQGEGGFYSAPVSFMRRLCHRPCPADPVLPSAVDGSDSGRRQGRTAGSTPQIRNPRPRRGAERDALDRPATLLRALSIAAADGVGPRPFRALRKDCRGVVG